MAGPGRHPSQSTAWLRRLSVRESLLPNLDQTRNTGLVTLPGAFIGALFGGASPVEAAMFQLTMLRHPRQCRRSRGRCSPP
ncbi:hypothetical protein EGT56_00030 [Arachnia propionica]|nr:hypothetical protein EGT56_00030 [Arachnia propionica]